MTRGLATCVVLAAVLSACRDRPAPAPAPAPPARAADPLDTLRWDPTPLDWTRPIAQVQHDISGFAGSLACKACHEQIYASYARHSMARTGMRPIESVDQAWIARIFDAGTAVVHAQSGFSYRPLRHGAHYFVAEALLDVSGAPIATWEEPVTHVFSAGSYGLAFYSRRGDRLIHLPIDYYAKAARWDLDPMAFGGNPRIGVTLDPYCISCHSDEPAKRFVDPLPGGIGCERCHGPSKRHIETLGVKDTVNPAHLPARRQLEVCAQCHQSTFPVLREGRDHFGFRPGDALDDLRVNFFADPAETDRVKLLAHAERLVRSACWRGARDKLTCTTCHDPHTSSLEKTAAWWDGKCMQCHDRKACTDTPEHRAAVGDHCVTCHMRSGATANVPLVSVTDHWIQKRPPPIRPGPVERPTRLVAWSSAIGEPVTDDGMAAITALAHADAGFTDETVRLAVAAASEHPTAALDGLIANVYLSRRRERDAGDAYRAALRLDPDNAGALLGYARVMLDARAPPAIAEARHALERALKLDADDVAALETLGIHLYRSGDRAAAIELFRRAAATGRATGVSYVGLAIEEHGHAAKELDWLELAWRAEPRDRWILDELARAAAGDHARSDELARRRAAVEKLPGGLRSTAATAWIPR
ncbi:MAG TPA: hypothetical protein VGF94_02085 [Kofleriaceae bacterium]